MVYDFQHGKEEDKHEEVENAVSENTCLGNNSLPSSTDLGREKEELSPTACIVLYKRRKKL